MTVTIYTILLGYLSIQLFNGFLSCELQVVDSKLASKLWTIRLLKIKTLSIWS